MTLFVSRPPPAETEIDIDGRPLRVRVRIHARARHYRLSLPASGQPVLTLPPRGRWDEARAFLERHRGWLAARISRSPEGPALAEGALVPLRGVPHRIAASGRLRGRVEIAAEPDEAGAPVLLVPGEPAHLPRRLVDWLRREAQADLARQSAHHAATLGVAIRAITLRDQSTRWGSCSASGRLSYNWRLVLAPPFVLDYVAAHEVAHLVEMNHSPAFWATVARALPDYRPARAWLKAHGRELMAFAAP